MLYKVSFSVLIIQALSENLRGARSDNPSCTQKWDFLMWETHILLNRDVCIFPFLTTVMIHDYDYTVLLSRMSQKGKTS